MVESAEVLPTSTLRDESLESCLIESMLAVQFEPPSHENGRVDIIYPFELAPDPPDAGAGSGSRP